MKTLFQILTLLLISTVASAQTWSTGDYQLNRKKSTSGFEVAELLAGSNVAFTWDNTAKTLSIASTAGGTVTSFAATDSTGIDFTVTNPTTTPTLSLSLATWPGTTAITTVGTITTGTWQGTVIAPAYLASSPVAGEVLTATSGTTADWVAPLGSNLTDPNEDRILFWDDSAGNVAWLTLSGLTITGTTLSPNAVGNMTTAVYDSYGVGRITGLKGADDGAFIGGAGGELRLQGGDAGAGYNGGDGGSVWLNGSATDGGRGGSLVSTGSSPGYDGGTLDMSAGTTAAGGNIVTSDGGGTINTNTGVIQLGVSGTRTTLSSTATANRSINLPDASGTLLLSNGDGSGLTGVTASAVSDATLTAMAGVTTAADKMIYFTGVDTAAATGLKATARTLLDLNTLAEWRFTLADGSSSTGTAGLVRANQPTITTPTITGSVVWQNGTRQTFSPSLSTAGFNVGSVSADPNPSVSNGDLWYNSTANQLKARINGATVSLGAVGYTVATLPSTAGTGMVTGAFAYVTDATAPTYLGTLTGGGTVVCPVFYNGTAWVAH